MVARSPPSIRSHEGLAGSRDAVAVVGAGAIGSIIGAYLARAGHAVTIVDGWWHHVEAIRRHGLSVHSPEEKFVTEIAALHIDEMDRLERPIDVLVLAPKCYDTEVLARLARPYLAGSASVISAQNGIMEERLPQWVDRQALVGCVVRTAGELFVPGEVVRRLGVGWPVLTLGEFDGGSSERLDQLTEVLSPAGEVRTTMNIWGELWAKLVQNLMASPAGGVTGCTTRILWSDPVLVDVAIALAGEAITVAEGLGHAVEPIFGILPADRYRDAHGGDQGARDEIVQLMRKVAAQRRGHRENAPSLVHDLRKGRRTEIGYLCGHVVRHAEGLSITTPVNAGIADLVDQVSRGELEASAANIDLVGQLIT